MEFKVASLWIDFDPPHLVPIIKQVLICDHWSQIADAEKTLMKQDSNWHAGAHFEHYANLSQLRIRLWDAILNEQIDLKALTFSLWKLIMLGAINLTYPIWIVDQSHFENWQFFTIHSIDDIFYAIDFVCKSAHFIVYYNYQYHRDLQQHFLFIQKLFKTNLVLANPHDFYQSQAKLLNQLKLQVWKAQELIQLKLEQAADWSDFDKSLIPLQPRE